MFERLAYSHRIEIEFVGLFLTEIAFAYLLDIAIYSK